MVELWPVAEDSSVSGRLSWLKPDISPKFLSLSLCEGRAGPGMLHLAGFSHLLQSTP